MTDGNPRTGDGADNGLAPPFVPGGGRRPARAEPDTAPSPESELPPETAEDMDPSTAEGAEDPFPFEAEGVAEAAETDDDDFPFDAFDIGGGGDTQDDPEPEPIPEATAQPIAPTEEEAAADSAAVGPEAALDPDAASAPEHEDPATTGSPVQELADRLEQMARDLREGGPQATESAMDSDDRFTALLAGLLAGYLAGRQ